MTTRSILTRNALGFATLALSALVTLAVRAGQDDRTPDSGPVPAARASVDQDPFAELVASFAEEGIDLDLAGGFVSIEAGVGTREQLLEYLLVGPGGATHESLFYTTVRPSLLNAAFLALGVSPGKNANWVELTDEEAAAAVADEPEGTPPPAFRIVPPHGDGFFVHAAWKEGDEVYFHRVEDLVANLATGRAMEREPFVFLGSRMATIAGMVHPLHERRDDETVPDADEEVFLADFERNLINLIYFKQGNTLLTAVHGDQNRQDVWAANIWNVPDTDQPLRLVFAREPLERVPDALRDALPKVVRPDKPSRF